MGQKDTVTKEYMQDETTFADAFNYYLYGGEPVIRPERLRPLDPTMIVLPYGEDGSPVPTQKYRDVSKVLTAMEDDRAAYLLLAVEAQSEIHYAQPVRTMLYDAIQYASQVSAAKTAHRKAGRKTKSDAEFLSGFYATDRLLPVITLTIYFGSEDWTGSRDLHGMLSADRDILRYVPNYWIHLISPAEIADEDFQKFRSELKVALKYIKYSKDGRKLLNAAQSDPAFTSVSRKTFDLINLMTNSKLVYPKGKEKGDMCKAVNDLIEMGRNEATKELEKKVKAAEEKSKAAEEKSKAAEEKYRDMEVKYHEAVARANALEEKLKSAGV